MYVDKRKKEFDVIVPPCGGSENKVVSTNIYICPDKPNKKKTTFLAPYARQQVKRYAPILKLIRDVRITNNQNYANRNYETFLSKELINEINDEKICSAIANWYFDKGAWDNDIEKQKAIQIYILGEWIELPKPQKPRNVSANRFMNTRYANIKGLYNAKNLDECMETID